MAMEDYFTRNPVLLYMGEKIVEEIVDKTNRQCLDAIETAERKDNIVRKKLNLYRMIRLTLLKN